jgi:anti-sigma factor RsiW
MELMLEADVVALEGRDDSGLSVHIRECPRCTSKVQLILSEQQELQQLLQAEHPGTSLDVALARAGTRAVSARRSRRIWQAAIPLAAAAGLTGILLSNGSHPASRDSVWMVPEHSAGVGLDIETPPGKNVAVFEVEDRPDIVVVWFYDQGD